MEPFLNSGIKEVIQKYPQIGSILEEYQIGCVPCSVGTCLLKDIVSIHALPPDQEKQMMARIAKVIYPDQEVEIPQLSTPEAPSIRAFKLSPPMKTLVEEHVLIKRWLALIPLLLKDLNLEKAADRETILRGVDFIRSYADRFHHAKEEDILFGYFDKDLDILKVMTQDHLEGRSHVKAVVEGIEKRNQAEVAVHLKAYRDLLTQHIKKEDEILFPWMETNLTMPQIGELFSRFQATDEQMGDRTSQFEAFITNLENNYQP
ncbi:MAG: hemerythrin domain-containing protein [Thermodesulfobacteriota bacterium]